MKKNIILTLLAALSMGTFAENQAPENPEIALGQKTNFERTTSGFTGIEYEKFNKENGKNNYDISYILVDGSTQLTEEWKLIHIAKRRQSFLA